MKAGLNLYSVRNLIKTEEDFAKTAAALAEMGYSYIQYSGAEFDPARIARVSAASGLPVVLTHVPMERILEDTDALMREHEQFGCHNIGLGAMPATAIADATECRKTVEALNERGAYMAARGFRFFYHHHHYEFFRHDGVTVFDTIINEAPHINITLDTYWLQYGGVDILKTIDRLGGRIGCVHLKDYGIKQEQTEEGKIKFAPIFVPVGAGSIDFAAVVAAAKKAGTEYFLVEQDNAAKLEDPLGEVARSIRYIRENL